MGDTFQLFDWSGVSPTGTFNIVAAPGWDVSQLYTAGEVTYVGTVPDLEPSFFSGSCCEPVCLRLATASAGSLRIVTESR